MSLTNWLFLQKPVKNKFRNVLITQSCSNSINNSPWRWFGTHEQGAVSVEMPKPVYNDKPHLLCNFFWWEGDLVSDMVLFCLFFLSHVLKYRWTSNTQRTTIVKESFWVYCRYNLLFWLDAAVGYREQLATRKSNTIKLSCSRLNIWPPHHSSKSPESSLGSLMKLSNNPKQSQH